MASKLILITRRFPYFTTEAFLESEIEFHVNSFNKVVFYPAEIGSVMRSVPEQVTVNNDLGLYLKRKFQRIFDLIFSKTLFVVFLENFKKIGSMRDFIFVFRFAYSAHNYLSFFRKNQDILDDDSVVYFYWFNAGVYGLIRLKEFRNSRFSIISRAHRYDLYEGVPSSPSFWPSRKVILGKIDRVFVISQDGKRFLEERYKAFGNIIVSRLGVFDYGVSSKEPKDGEVHIVSVSRVHPMKRVDLIARSVHRLSEICPHVRILWTHFGDGEDLEKVKGYVNSVSGFESSFPGSVSNETIIEFYRAQAISFFINLSSSEGIPVSIMEALSFGIPVIATSVGGTPEIISKETGVLLDANPELVEINKAMLLVLENRFDRQRIKASWHKNFNAQINYSKFSNLLLNLV